MKTQAQRKNTARRKASFKRKNIKSKLRQAKVLKKKPNGRLSST